MAKVHKRRMPWLGMFAQRQSLRILIPHPATEIISISSIQRVVCHVIASSEQQRFPLSISGIAFNDLFGTEPS